MIVWAGPSDEFDRIRYPFNAPVKGADFLDGWVGQDMDDPNGFYTIQLLRRQADGRRYFRINDSITVNHVATVYHEHAKLIYSEGSKDLARIKKLTDELIEHYSEVLGDEFGPRALKEQRKRWIDAGNSRKYCNRFTNGVIRMYKHVVAEELVDQSVWQRLLSLEPLRAGQNAATAAKVAKWLPNQLRHLAGTIARDALGPEAAQTLLGHANSQMTEHYAIISERKVVEAARHAPKL